VPVGRTPGKVEDLSGIALSQVREMADLREACGDGIIALGLLEGLVDGEQVDVDGGNLCQPDNCQKSKSEDGIPRLLTVLFERAD
jgi:hypothetical protein